MIATLHVQCWHEAYAGLLPATEISRRSIADRIALWTRVLDEGQFIVVAPEVGFAQVSFQREDALRPAYPRELWCLYTLRSAHGTGIGRQLLQDALGSDPAPFTACVIDGNDRALGFYRKTGATVLETRAETIGQTPITEHLLGWDSAAAAALSD